MVRLARQSLAGDVGIETVPVIEENHAHHLTANAETAFDANQHAQIYPRVTGYLRDVRADLGDIVASGDVLAVVDSAEVSAAKTRYIATRAAVELAHVTHDRTSKLTRSGALAARQELETLTALNQAEAAVLDAEQTLRNLGFTDTDLDRVSNERDTSSFLEVLAPIGGTVVRRQATQGEAIQPTTPIFSVADTSTMWLWIDVYEPDIDGVAVGQTVRFEVPDCEKALTTGTVTWVGAEVDPTTRTTRVRAELSNPECRLRANQFGRALIQVGSPHDAIVVPKDAVQRKEGSSLVFLNEGVGVYRPQRIVTRPADKADVVEVAWGLKPGQKIVTTGSYLLKTEIMKGAIGAGCCE